MPKRKAGPPFVLLRHYMLDSEAWRSLSSQCQAVYLAVARVYNGSNNGYLGRGVRDLAELAHINKDTAAKCLKILIERGFLECTSPGGFSLKLRHTAEWRLTIEKCDRTGELPAKAFLKWRA